MTEILKDRRIVVAVTGGIAAYKAADLVSRLRKHGAHIKVIMTENALQFIQPLTLETISGNRVYYDTFSKTSGWEIDHISLAQWAELMVVAPATANIIGKVCHGIADDLLSTAIMAASSKVIFAPAMNTRMYRNPVVQRNIEELMNYGYDFIQPAKGRLACGDWGEGKLADVEDIFQAINDFFSSPKDLENIKVLVTAGPTHEFIDPVRYITNPSSGKMGYALAEACLERGALVDLVSGPVNLEPPKGANVHLVENAQQMYDKVMELYPECKLVFKAAAVGDYRPAVYKSEKIKKNENSLTLELIRNPDILKELGKRKKGQILVGFAAETTNIEEYARKKIHEKNLDFILANDVTQAGAGFKGSTNQGVLITSMGNCIAIPLMDKKKFSHKLIDEILMNTDISN